MGVDLGRPLRPDRGSVKGKTGSYGGEWEPDLAFLARFGLIAGTFDH